MTTGLKLILKLNSLTGLFSQANADRKLPQTNAADATRHSKSSQTVLDHHRPVELTAHSVSPKMWLTDQPTDHVPTNPNRAFENQDVIFQSLVFQCPPQSRGKLHDAFHTFDAPEITTNSDPDPAGHSNIRTQTAAIFSDVSGTRIRSVLAD